MALPEGQEQTDDIATLFKDGIRAQYPDDRFPWAIQDMKFDGHNASELVAVGQEQGRDVTHIFHFLIEKGFLLTIVTRCNNDTDEELLKNCRAQIKFRTGP